MDDLWKHLAEPKHAQESARAEHFYMLTSANAVRHLYNVASGIDSMVLGDVQILNQIKESFALAQQEHCVGSVLSRLFTSSLHVGKRTKNETEISEGAVSVSYAAAELASKIFEDLTKRTALLIGAGETGELTAVHLRSRDIGNLWVTNRTRDHAQTLAGKLGGSVVDFAAMQDALHQSDIVISSVNVSSHVLTANDIRAAMKHRGNRPLVIIDIGVPRNIDPAANRIDNVFLHDIDGLNNIIDRNISQRKAEVPKVERIVLDEVIAFERWYTSLDVTPTIQELREQFEDIRATEVAKHLSSFPPETRETVEMMTRRIVNKILHTPMVNLRNGRGDGSGHESLHKVDLIRHLFGLDKQKEE
jgi:glutamyl-tRNA reductase